MLRLWMVVALLAAASPALADPWVRVYDDGICTVDRKVKGNGQVKDKVRCDRAPLYVVPPPVVMVEPEGDADDDDRPPVFAHAGGGACREYRTTATIEGRRQPLHGTVCRQPDGSWAFVE